MTENQPGTLTLILLTPVFKGKRWKMDLLATVKQGICVGFAE